MEKSTVGEATSEGAASEPRKAVAPKEPSEEMAPKEVAMTEGEVVA